MEYQILETLEAGIVLSGAEVKAVRAGKASLAGAYVKIYGNEAWLVQAHIAPYQEKNTPKDYDPVRARKLLISKGQIRSLIGTGKEKGVSLIPLQLYDKRGIIKVELAIAKGKKQHDKREAIHTRETKRTLDRYIKQGKS